MNRNSFSVWWTMMLLALTVTACTGTQSPLSTADPVLPQNSPGGELTLDEHRSTTPPPPKNVRISREGNEAKITWEAPDPVQVPHGYGDEVLYYKVFKREPGQVQPTQIGTTKETSYVESTVSPGATYLVVAVYKGLQGGELDGDWSNEVSLGG